MNCLVFFFDFFFGFNFNCFWFFLFFVIFLFFESFLLFKEGDINNNNFLLLWFDEDVMMVVVVVVVVNDVGCKLLDLNFLLFFWVVGMVDVGGDEGDDVLEGDDE